MGGMACRPALVMGLIGGPDLRIAGTGFHREPPAASFGGGGFFPGLGLSTQCPGGAAGLRASRNLPETLPGNTPQETIYGDERPSPARGALGLAVCRPGLSRCDPGLEPGLPGFFGGEFGAGGTSPRYCFFPLVVVPGAHPPFALQSPSPAG